MAQYIQPKNITIINVRFITCFAQNVNQIFSSEDISMNTDNRAWADKSANIRLSHQSISPPGSINCYCDAVLCWWTSQPQLSINLANQEINLHQEIKQKHQKWRSLVSKDLKRKDKSFFYVCTGTAHKSSCSKALNEGQNHLQTFCFGSEWS